MWAKKRISYLSNFKGTKDIDVIKIVQRMDDLFNIMATINVNYNDKYDLTESTFVSSPLVQINKSLANFDFIPINNWDIEEWRKIFENSKIMEPNLISSDFISMFAKIKEGKLLYRMTTDGVGTDKFHQKWAKQGPTIILVKANGGYIFGGYNPFSWIEENVYLNAPRSFLFSVTDGRDRRPIKFPVRQSRADCAIRWWESQWSPGFGEEGVSDLFIAFKNPKNSYSRLGIVYEVPDEFVQGEFLLAGRRDGWNVEEIEVYLIVTDKDK